MAESDDIPSRRLQPVEGARFPDFIIAGAMKSGTTSLHHILASDRRIFIPEHEIFFFDMDDLVQHPDFCYRDGDAWWFPRYRPDDASTLAWYSQFFAPAGPGQWVGEDSTTYLASTKAAERIANLVGTTKIILLLRDPASRCYSHYWHLVRTGRATVGFEDAIRFSPGTLLQRSLYEPQVRRYREVFDDDRLMILIFEEFVANVDSNVRRVYRFLEIPEPTGSITTDTHHNAALVPRWPRAQLWWNAVRHRWLGPDRYRGHLLNAPAEQRSKKLVHLADRVLGIVNPSLPKRPPPMSPGTRRLLNGFFAEQNDGLDALVGKDLRRYWYRDGRE